MVSIPRSAQALAEQIRLSSQRLQPFRVNRTAMIREYCGPHYGPHPPGDSSTGPTPINSIAWYCHVMVPHLIYENVRALIKPKRYANPADPVEDFDAEVRQAAWNLLAEEIALDLTLRKAATDTLFAGIAIVKTGIVKPPRDDQEGYLHDPGKPFCDNISLDDYEIDPFAKMREAALWEGNRFRMAKSAMLESGLYDNEKVERLGTFYQTQANQQRTSNASLPGGIDLSKAPEPMLECMEVWLPHEQTIVTLPTPESGVDGFLREEEYIGPERGPYEDLQYHQVPDNAIGVAPIAIVYDLHVMLNKAARKAGRQADRQKDIVLVDQTAAEGEVIAVKNAGDGDVISVQDSKRYQQVSMGGANDKNYQHIAFLLEQFNRIARNPELIGGTAAKSGTLGQDQMLMQAAAGSVEDLRGCVQSFADKIGQKLFWYLSVLPEQRQVMLQKGGRQIPVNYMPEASSEELEYAFEVDLYSKPPGSPESRYQRMMEWLQNVVQPWLPVAMQQGIAIDIGRLFKDTAKLHGIDYPEDYIREMPPQMQTMPGQEGAGAAEGMNAQEAAMAAGA